MLKRSLALFIVFALIMTLVPASVIAQEPEEEGSVVDSTLEDLGGSVEEETVEDSVADDLATEEDVADEGEVDDSVADELSPEEDVADEGAVEDSTVEDLAEDLGADSEAGDLATEADLADEGEVVDSSVAEDNVSEIEDLAVNDSGDMSPMAATSKALATNFTLVNLGTSAATATADYKLSDGSTWSNVPSSYTTDISLSADGGQAIFRHYGTEPGSMSDGQGSVVIQADQAIAAVAQIQAPDESSKSSGAYSAFSAGSNKFYVPLVMRQLTTGDGTGNSQIVVQNTGSASVDVTVEFYDATGSSVGTKSLTGIASGASSYFDLTDDTTVSEGFYGSAVVTAGSSGTVAVVSNLFLGSDQLQTFNGFSSDNVGTTWFAPLVTSRLTNQLSTPISVQNLSGAELAVNSITLSCTDGTGGGNDFSINNSTAVANNASYFFNPVVDTTNFPDAWYGSCKVEATGDVVTFVQMRFVGLGRAAAYEGINGNGTATEVVIPLVAKRLSNGFATALTIQNLGSSDATVDVTYTHASDTAQNTSFTGLTVPGDGSIIHNHAVATGADNSVSLSDGWYGAATIKSTNGQPIQAFMQLRYVDMGSGVPSGDTYMAHNAFTR